MATKVFLSSPGKTIEDTVEGVGGVVQSSFVVGFTVDMATTTINADGTTRKITKAEVLQALEQIEYYITKDPNSDFG